VNGNTGEPGPTDRRADLQLAFLRGLVDEHATIAGDLVELAPDTWAIHGSIRVDGDVILAEFADPDQARTVLGQLPRA
jgi:hypothetical protein